MAGALRPLAFFEFVGHRKSDRTQGRRRVDSNRRRSQRPRPCDPRSPLTRLRGFLTGQTDGSTDCATYAGAASAPLRLGYAPCAQMRCGYSSPSCRRSGEMWSHGNREVRPLMEKCGHTSFFWCRVSIPAGCRSGEHACESVGMSERPRCTLTRSSSSVRRMASYDGLHGMMAKRFRRDRVNVDGVRKDGDARKGRRSAVAIAGATEFERRLSWLFSDQLRCQFRARLVIETRRSARSIKLDDWHWTVQGRRW